jgi:hypothetical protein
MYTKFAVILILIAVLGCNRADERAQQHEETLIGNWKSNKDRYLELNEDRTGKECFVMYRNQRPYLPPKLTFDVKRWQLRHDTLIIDFLSETPLFGGKLKIDSTNHPGTEYFVIGQESDNQWVINKVLQGATFKVKEEFTRVEQIPENN